MKNKLTKKERNKIYKTALEFRLKGGKDWAAEVGPHTNGLCYSLRVALHKHGHDYRCEPGDGSLCVNPLCPYHYMQKYPEIAKYKSEPWWNNYGWAGQCNDKDVRIQALEQAIKETK